MWLDKDVELYDFAKVRPLIKKKQVKVRRSLSNSLQPHSLVKAVSVFDLLVCYCLGLEEVDSITIITIIVYLLLGWLSRAQSVSSSYLYTMWI